MWGRREYGKPTQCMIYTQEAFEIHDLLTPKGRISLQKNTILIVSTALKMSSQLILMLNFDPKSKPLQICSQSKLYGLSFGCQGALKKKKKKKVLGIILMKSFVWPKLHKSSPRVPGSRVKSPESQVQSSKSHHLATTPTFFT